MPSGSQAGNISREGAFPTTHWTAVLEAARPESDPDRQAFGRLYADYWYPLYTFVRRRGYSPQAAEDLAQDFFARLLEKQALAGVQRQGGKFRSFLLGALGNFLANDWDRQHAQKRGAGVHLASLDAEGSERRFALEPLDEISPDLLFERQWVFTLLEHVIEQLRAECEAGGKAELFQALQHHLQGDRTGEPYAVLAARLHMSEGAIKVAAHRFRQRYGELLRQEIARTVSSPEEVDEELRHLIAIVGR